MPAPPQKVAPAKPAPARPPATATPTASAAAARKAAGSERKPASTPSAPAGPEAPPKQLQNLPPSLRNFAAAPKPAPAGGAKTAAPPATRPQAPAPLPKAPVGAGAAATKAPTAAGTVSSTAAAKSASKAPATAPVKPVTPPLLTPGTLARNTAAPPAAATGKAAAPAAGKAAEAQAGTATPSAERRPPAAPGNPTSPSSPAPAARSETTASAPASSAAPAGNPRSDGNRPAAVATRLAPTPGTTSASPAVATSSRSASVAPLADEPPQTARERGPDESHGFASLSLISAAAPSPRQVLALAQAALVVQDSLQSEAAIRQQAEARRQLVEGLLSGARAMVAGLFSRGLFALQGFIEERLATLTRTVAAAINLVTQIAMGVLQVAQGWLEQARTMLQTRFQAVMTGVQERIAGITSRITGFIGSFTLPDLPGVAAIRSVASGLLGNGAALVNRALGRTTQIAGNLINTGFSMLDTLMQGFGGMISSLLGRAVGFLMQVMGTVTRLFHALASDLGRLLMIVLDNIALRLFERIGAMAGHWITRLQQRAISSLRENRRQALQALADAVAPAVSGSTPPDTGQARRAGDHEASLQQIRQDALLHAQRIVRLFDLLSGGALLALLSLVPNLMGRLQSFIALLVATAIGGIGAVLMQTLHALYRMTTQLIQAIHRLLETLVRMFTGAIEQFARLLASPADSLRRFAEHVWTRLSESIRGLIANFLRAVTGAPVTDAASLAGEHMPVDPVADHAPAAFPEIEAAQVLAILPVLLLALGGGLAFASAGMSAAMALGSMLLALIFMLALLLLQLMLRWPAGRSMPPAALPPPSRRLIRIMQTRNELGVGGFDLPAYAKVAPGVPSDPALTWKINPGGMPPVGVSVVGSGRHVRLRSTHPPHGTVLGDTTITVRAALASNPLDFADSAPITLVQVLSANYSATPPLSNINIPANPMFGGSGYMVEAPLNTGEPNRDGISGNIVDVNAFLRPSGRPVRLELRRPRGATASAMTVKPGRETGDIGLRILDTTTGATLDESLPSTEGGAALMADLMINAVPLRVSSITTQYALATHAYGAYQLIQFTPSDSTHLPLKRITGELIDKVRDDFNLSPPNLGYNTRFVLMQAGPANVWLDCISAPVLWANTSDNRPAIDVNRFVGDAVPQLPRYLRYSQDFQYAAWHSAGTVSSQTTIFGYINRTLYGTPAMGFYLATEHGSGSMHAAPWVQPYAGPPLIDFSNLLVTPDARGATALAADGASTATVTLASTVPDREVRWDVMTGDMSFGPAGNALAPVTLQAGRREGLFRIRACDSIYPNRNTKLGIHLSKVVLHNIRAADPVVPPGIYSTTVSLEARPGGRTVRWEVNADAAAAGVTLTPATTGPGPAAMSVTVTRPVGYTGVMTVTATDSVLPTEAARVPIQFN